MRLLSSLGALLVLAVMPAAEAQRMMVCYYEAWAVYRPGNGQFQVEDINPHLCTHAMYAFIGLDENGSVFSLDPWEDIDNGGFQRFNALRKYNSNLKTMVAIGGWNANSSIFSDVVTDPIVRQVFVDNLYDFVMRYDFDGLDFDWEYPAQRGGRPSDKENYVLLLRELRAKFSPAGLLLSAGVHANPKAVVISYDVPELAINLDFISLMTYDYHGYWDNVTGINSPLHAAPEDPDQTFNIEYTVQLWLDSGAPASKLTLGIPLYGRSFTLAAEENNGLGETTIGPGDAGIYTQEPGNLAYKELCLLIREGGWTEQWAEQQQAPYMYQGDQWVTFDNLQSVAIKAAYGRDKNLAGNMVWAIDTDDFRGECGQGAYPLMNAILENS